MDRGTALDKLQDLIGKDLRKLADYYEVTVWKNGKINKGWAGHTVERYLGLPLNSSRNPNLGTWELKVVPLVLQGNGIPTVKETVAITMLDPKEVLTNTFEESHLFTKLRKIISVSRIRENIEETRSICMNVHAFDLEETDLYNAVAGDYEEIREMIGTKGFASLTGKMGTYVQPRTKGAGHGSTSRAFYARKNLVEYILGLKESPRSAEQLSIADCPVHAGYANNDNRLRLDERIVHLPANQSGLGRHKCPYCAYEQGYQQAIDDVLDSATSRAPRALQSRPTARPGPSRGG